MAEDLVVGNLIPLGKYLLGSVYHMLHQITHLMHTSQKIFCVNGPWWFANPLAYTSIISRPVILLLQRKKPPRPWRIRGNSQSRRAASHQRSEPFKSKFSFSILSLALDCNLMIHLLLFSALTCSQRRSLELKRFLSTSPLTPLPKKKTPHRNRRPTINCAVASGIWNTTYGTSPPVAVPNANAA
jgi:hypothetical protein